MSPPYSLNSIKKQAASFAGASQQIYTRRYSPHQLNEDLTSANIGPAGTQVNFWTVAPVDPVQGRVYEFIEGRTPTGLWYGPYTPRFNEPQIVPENAVQIVINVPSRILDLVKKFCSSEHSKKQLLDDIDLLAEWFVDASVEHQEYLATCLRSFPSNIVRLLLSSLEDQGFIAESFSVLNVVSSFLLSQDEYEAQTAASFLLVCGRSWGENIIQLNLQGSQVKHKDLIEGIQELLRS
jgi:hypothetical protein